MSDTGRPAYNYAYLKRLTLALQSLNVGQYVTQDKVVQGFQRLLRTLTGPLETGEELYLAYGTFYRLLAGKNWPEYLLGRLLAGADPPAGGDRWEEASVLPARLLADWQRDLTVIQAAASLDAIRVKAWITERWQRELDASNRAIYSDFLELALWPEWDTQSDAAPFSAGAPTEGKPVSVAQQWLNAKRRAFGQAFWRAKDWGANAALLVAYLQAVGGGLMSMAVAFRWDEERGLVGIAEPDPIRLENLIRQEREQKIVLTNTERFLEGHPASNVILYGNRGTGKSSLVKALLNVYAERGLRLVQLQKSQLAFLPEVGRRLARIPLKFIVFIDDLSFDDKEYDYKDLKSLLEGGLENRPANVLIYATSNRRHLIRETFAERSSEVHAQDQVDEKLSLADRFGITVSFISPDQESYLAIVRGLAAQNNLDMATAQLEELALRWAMLQNGRSGRTARQFIDSLIHR